MKLKSRIVLILTILMMLQGILFGGAALAAGTNLPNIVKYGLYSYVDSNTTLPTDIQVKSTGNDGATYTSWPWDEFTDVPYVFESNMGIGIEFAVNVATPTYWEQNATKLKMYDSAGAQIAASVIRLGDGTNTDENRHYIFVIPQVTLQPSNSYKIIVDADLTANNTNQAGKVQQINFTTAADTTSPSWSSGSLTASGIASTALTLSWTATAQDDVAVTGYKILQNGTEIGTVSGVNTLSYSVSALEANSTYSFQVLALDAAGNPSTNGPTTSATTGAATDSTSVSLNLNKSSAPPGGSVTVSGTAGPNRWVSIQALDSSQNIIFFDAVKSNDGGSYSDIFKVPAVSTGRLTVLAGYGSNVDSAGLNVIPEVTSDVSISGDGSNKNLAITANTPSDITVTVPQGVSGASINVGELLSSNASGGVSTSGMPALNIPTYTSLNPNPVQVKIPVGTIVSAPAGWTGNINPPTIQEANTVDVTPDNGKTVTVSTVIEIGYGDIPLTFSKAVRLLIPGQAGKYAGYSRNGQFTKISTTLAEDTQAAGDALADGSDGKIDVGSDLVIWTKHFTSFVTYTQTSSGDDNVPGEDPEPGHEPSKDRDFWVEGFTVIKNSSASYTLRFDLSNGMDREIPGNLSKVHVYKKSDRTLIPYSSYNYIKQGTNDNPPKIRRLELTYDDLFNNGESYLVEIDPEFTANNGNTFGTMYTTEFTISSSGTVQEGNSSGVVSFGSAGGTLDGENATIVIPAGAFNSEIKISIAKVSDISALPITSGSKILGTVVEITADRTGEFNQPVIITLPFDKSLVDLEKNRVSICWLDETTGKWNELENVKVDATTGTVSGGINHFTKFAVMAVEKTQQEVVPVLAPVINLNDIKGHWAQVQIEKLITAGAISGYPDSTFKPDQTISRAEFAAVLVKAFKLEAKNGKIFADTAEHWAKDAIATAAACGIVSGYDAETFAPDESITREQMAVMISKAAKLTPVESGKIFSDQEQISEWARDAVNRASGHEIISGYPDNSFQPKANATRAQAVTVIAKAS